MNREDEVLSFKVKFSELNDVKIIAKLQYFDKAPYGMNKDMTMEELTQNLFFFLERRSVAKERWDYENILKYTNSINGLELSFKGHGLSLSNHYWYKKEGENLKYEDINFFNNGWDDSFAKAVLSGNYEALKKADLNVPDVTTPGWAVKGWLFEESGPKLYKLGIAQDHFEEPLGEVLSSKLGKRMFNGDEILEYQLTKIYGKYASVCKNIINFDEELIPLYFAVPPELSVLYSNENHDRDVRKRFFEQLNKTDIPNLYEFFVKMSCFRSLSFVNDLHFGNLSVIKNLNTGKLRMAPLFDLASSFGSSERARSLLSNINKGTYALVYFMYSILDPDWDYSWYHEDSLLGFEDEIKEVLSKSDFYTPQLIDNIIDVYTHQKDYLNKLASKKDR